VRVATDNSGRCHRVGLRVSMLRTVHAVHRFLVSRSERSERRETGIVVCGGGGGGKTKKGGRLDFGAQLGERKSTSTCAFGAAITNFD